MPRSYWRVLFAAFGWLVLLGANHADTEAEIKQSQAQQSISRSLHDISRLYHEEAERAHSAKPETEYCGHGKYNADTDLCAQWKAADAAADSAWWAWASGLIGCVSLVFVLIAIGLAYHSNLIAQKVGQAQVRCYLTIEDVVVRFDAMFPSIKLSIYNSGQSPARNVQCFARIGYVEVGKSDVRWSPECAPVEGRNSMEVPADASEPCTEISTTHDMSDNETKVLYRPRGRVAIWCEVRVTATDVFDKAVTAHRAFVAEVKMPRPDNIPLTPAGTRAP